MIVELIIAAAAMAAPDIARQQVVCAETGFSRAAEARDEAKFLAFVDPDARFIAGGVARGKEEIRAAWGAVFAPAGPTIRWRPQVVEVSSDGNLALSRGPYRSSRVDENGETHYAWGHFNSTWRRNEAGVWLVMFDAGGDDGMEPTEDEIALLESEPECPDVQS